MGGSIPATIRTTTPPAGATQENARGLTQLLADAFGLYLKVKNVQWRAASSLGPACRAALARQADRLFALTDAISARIRRLGAARLPAQGQLARVRELREVSERRGDIDTARILRTLLVASVPCAAEGQP